MVNDIYKVSFTSEVYKVKDIVSNVLNFISKEIPALSYEDKGDLKLIFNELLFNAVIHGNRNDISKRVNVHVEISSNTITAVISDEGFGFDYMGLLSKFEEDMNLISESGRGIRLVYSLADSLAFNVSGNEIKFYKKVAVNNG